MLNQSKPSVFLRRMILGLLFSPFFILSAEQFLPPTTFIEAKKILFPLYLEHHPYTFYCGCRFNEAGIVVDCPPEAQDFVGERIEWEHIVPASLLGRDLDCWSHQVCPIEPPVKKGRACCQQTSEVFQWREAYLFNIVPVVKSLNRARSDYRPGYIFYKSQARHLCGLWIDKKHRRIEPDPHLRGFIARTYLHLHDRYQFPLKPHDKKLFEQWDKKFLPDLWEKDRLTLLNQYYSVDNNKEIPANFSQGAPL